MTLHFRPFIFNGIPFLLIRLTWGFLQTLQEGDGSEKQLLDGYMYPDSDLTEWKLVVTNVCILNFRDQAFIGEFSTDNVSFGCKGAMYLVDFP